MQRNNVCTYYIRRFCPNDAKTVSKLIRSTLNDINIKDYSLNVIQHLYDYYSPEHILENSQYHLVFVACLNNRIVGTVSLKDNSIFALFVESSMLNQGIGTLLMKNVESIVTIKGYPLVNVASSITAFNFYSKLGYQPISSNHSAKYGQVICMEKHVLHTRG